MSTLWAALHCILFVTLLLSTIFNYELINHWYHRGHRVRGLVTGYCTEALRTRQTPELQDEFAAFRQERHKIYKPGAVDDISLTVWWNEFIQTFDINEFLNTVKSKTFKLYSYLKF